MDSHYRASIINYQPRILTRGQDRALPKSPLLGLAMVSERASVQLGSKVVSAPTPILGPVSIQYVQLEYQYSYVMPSAFAIEPLSPCLTAPDQGPGYEVLGAPVTQFGL